MKNKVSYERATLHAIAFDVKDIITTSGTSVDNDTSIVLPEDIF